MTAPKLAAIATIVVAAIVVLVVVWPSSGDSGVDDGPTFVIAGVERRDLRRRSPSVASFAATN